MTRDVLGRLQQPILSLLNDTLSAIQIIYYWVTRLLQKTNMPGYGRKRYYFNLVGEAENNHDKFQSGQHVLEQISHTP
jgi:hypothetical protein